jgi:hypothetical protein
MITRQWKRRKTTKVEYFNKKKEEEIKKHKEDAEEASVCILS